MKWIETIVSREVSASEVPKEIRELLERVILNEPTEIKSKISNNAEKGEKMNNKVEFDIVATAKLLVNGEEMINNLNAARKMTEKPLQVVVCGLLKAGKSTLLNMLTDNVREELFATGATRTTVKNQTINHKNYTFVDTPGLDANEEDSKEALEAIYSSDALLLVHNLKKGELDSYEIDLLNLIKKTNPSISQKLTIVLTNLESCRDEKEAIEQKVMKKIKEIFVDNKINLFSISSTSYKKGLEENKKNLEKESGIPMLREHILNKLSDLEISLPKIRHERIAREENRLLIAIKGGIDIRKNNISMNNKSIIHAKDKFHKEADILIKGIRQRLEEFERKHS